MNSPGVVHKAKFVSRNGKEFHNYIDYIDRDEATRNYVFNDFSLFNDYMGNPEKSGSLFTADKDLLNNKEKKVLKEKFKLAQKHGSLMWQDVFSFDNDWLVEQGYYDEKTNVLDEERLRAAIRRTMNNQIERDNMNSAIWSASFHYNTDNIHIHVATVELSNKPKERGKRTQSSIDRMKSDFINELRDRQNEYQKINEIIRENIINSREKFLSSDDKILREKTIELLKKLPTNRRYWYYDYNKINHVKPLLNSISKYYIQNYHREDYKELMKRLTIEEIEFKRVYGEGQEGKNKDRYKDYKKNKLNDLYKRLGNSILKELREHVKEEENKLKNKNRQYKLENKEENISIDEVSEDKNQIESLKENFKYEKTLTEGKLESNFKNSNKAEDKNYKNKEDYINPKEENNSNKLNSNSEKDYENSKEKFKTLNKDNDKKRFKNDLYEKIGDRGKKNFKKENYNSEGETYRNKEKNNFNEFKTNERNSYKSSKENFRTFDEFYSENNFENEYLKIFRSKSRNSCKPENKFNISINPGTINKMKKAMNNTLEKYLNKREYERAERNKEYEREKEQENELEI